MSVQPIPDTFDPGIYNRVAGHPLQSWEWGEARRRMGIKILRLGVWEGESLVDVVLMTIHPITYLGLKIGYIPRSRIPTDEVVAFLYKYGQENNFLFIKWEPNERAESSSLPASLRRSAHPLFPEWTQVLDLTPSEEDLLKGMKSKTRYNIKLAQRKGVTVTEESTDKGFEIFSRLYFETCARQKYFGHTQEYHQIVWESLRKNIAHILIAWYQDIPLTTYELFSFHDTLYYPYGGSSTQYKNVMAANLIMWEAIRFGKKLGAGSFDMWGSASPEYALDNSYSGFTRFKEGYGTEFWHMVGSYDLVFNPTLYAFYTMSYNLRTWFLSR